MPDTKNAPWLEKKFIDPKRLEAAVCELRRGGLSLAMLNGSFDLLHAGHLFIVHQASLQADKLIVALNSDASICRYKSEKRPIVPLQYRLEMIAALEFVDYVTFFEEDNPCELIGKVRPDVHVNGEEYGTECVEAKAVRTCGARLHIVRRVPSLSTSQLIEKIRQCV